MLSAPKAQRPAFFTTEFLNKAETTLGQSINGMEHKLNSIIKTEIINPIVEYMKDLVIHHEWGLVLGKTKTENSAEGLVQFIKDQKLKLNTYKGIAKTFIKQLEN